MEKSELFDRISDAWKECITDYELHRINSERSLQASLWSKLVNRLSPDKYPIFIEPGLRIEGQGKVFPDIVICDETRAIAIIELKYQPRAKPNWGKDIDTLFSIHQNREKICYKHKRHEGPERVFSIAEDVLFVWAGIHLPLGKEIAVFLCEAVLRGEKEKLVGFKELHHETGKTPGADVTRLDM